MKEPRGVTKKKWLGKAENCDICGWSFSLCDYFVDGKTKRGQWALMCPNCHIENGNRLGTGLGQKYDSETMEYIEG